MFKRLRGEKFDQNYVTSTTLKSGYTHWNYKSIEDVIVLEIWDVPEPPKKKKNVELKLQHSQTEDSDDDDNSDSSSSDEDLDDSKDLDAVFEQEMKLFLQNSGKVEEGSHMFTPTLNSNIMDIYKNAHAVILMVNPQKKKSWRYARKIIKKVPHELDIIIMINFKDLESGFKVTKKEIDKWAASHEKDTKRKVFILESSMKDCFGIKNLFTLLNVPFCKLKIDSVKKELKRLKDEYKGNLEEVDLNLQSSDYNQFKNWLKNGNIPESSVPFAREIISTRSSGNTSPSTISNSPTVVSPTLSKQIIATQLKIPKSTPEPTQKEDDIPEHIKRKYNILISQPNISITKDKIQSVDDFKIEGGNDGFWGADSEDSEDDASPEVFITKDEDVEDSEDEKKDRKDKKSKKEKKDRKEKKSKRSSKSSSRRKKNDSESSDESDNKSKRRKDKDSKRKKHSSKDKSDKNSSPKSQEKKNDKIESSSSNNLENNLSTKDLEKEYIEKERIEKENIEKERIEKEKIEKERKEIEEKKRKEEEERAAKSLQDFQITEVTGSNDSFFGNDNDSDDDSEDVQNNELDRNIKEDDNDKDTNIENSEDFQIKTQKDEITNNIQNNIESSNEQSQIISEISDNATDIKETISEEIIPKNEITPLELLKSDSTFYESEEDKGYIEREEVEEDSESSDSDSKKKKRGSRRNEKKSTSKPTKPSTSTKPQIAISEDVLKAIQSAEAELKANVNEQEQKREEKQKRASERKSHRSKKSSDRKSSRRSKKKKEVSSDSEEEED